MIFHGASEDWETDLDRRNRHVVIDELVVPGRDPWTQPPSVLRELVSVLWPFFVAFAFSVGIAVAVVS